MTFSALTPSIKARCHALRVWRMARGSVAEVWDWQMID